VVVIAPADMLGDAEPDIPGDAECVFPLLALLPVLPQAASATDSAAMPTPPLTRVLVCISLTLGSVKGIRECSPAGPDRFILFLLPGPEFAPTNHT